MDIDVQVDSTVSGALNSIKLKFARQALRKALNAGIKVLGQAIVAVTPEQGAITRKLGIASVTTRQQSAITKEFGTLKSNAGIKVEVDPNAAQGFAIFGFGRLGFLARWNEFGHVQVGHKVIGPQLKGKRNYESSRYLGLVPGRPFVRPAFDANEQAAMDAFATEVQKSLEEPVTGASKKQI